MLYSPQDRTIAGLQPDTICCMASPMLGVRKTLPWVARAALWLFGGSINPTLADMTLSTTDPAPYLEEISRGQFLDALGAFKRRVIAGATHGDVLCPYATSMLVTGSPTTEPCNLSTQMVGAHQDASGEIPQLECEVEEHFERDS